MVFGQIFRCLLGQRFLKHHQKILDDAAKQTILFGQVLIDSLYLWPLGGGIGKRTCFWAILTACIIHQTSLIAYVFTSHQDVDSLIMSMSSITIGLQVMAKLVSFYSKSDQLAHIIKMICDQFWPADLMGEDIEKGINQNSKILSTIFATQYFGGLGFLLMYIVIPFTNSSKQLPHNAWYPFDVSSTPSYEILLGLQIFLTTYIYLHIVCAYDYFYCAAGANCVEQFRLLSQIIRYVGGDNCEEFVKVLSEFSAIRHGGLSTLGDENATKLLIICINHHQRLIDFSNQLNMIFGNGHLIQLFASIMGVCTTCYRLTTETSFNNLAFSLMFCVSHFCQLLMYCGVSNELSFWSTRLSIDAFQSYWYVNKYENVRKCISIVMMRSQRAITMSTVGIVELNYSTFVSVLRFTFSFYTFLNQMAEK